MSRAGSGARRSFPILSLRVFLWAGAIFFIAAILRLGAPILVLVAEALLFWFILNGMARGLRNIPAFGPRLSRPVSILLAAAILAAFAGAAILASADMLSRIGRSGTSLQGAITPVIDLLARLFDTPPEELLVRAEQYLGLETLLGRIVAGVLDLVGKFGVVAILVAFLLVDQPFFEAKLAALFPDPGRREAARGLLSHIAASIERYLWILALASLLTGLLSYFLMRLVGLENAAFWSIVVFFLNFIPTIGAILGAGVPVVIALAQFGEVAPAAFLAVTLGLVQFVIGNILLPRMYGGALNISLFVTILSLFVWGALWGVTGMLLAIPINSSLIIVMAHFPQTRPMAILLSRTGALDTPADPES